MIMKIFLGKEAGEVSSFLQCHRFCRSLNALNNLLTHLSEGARRSMAQQQCQISFYRTASSFQHRPVCSSSMLMIISDFMSWENMNDRQALVINGVLIVEFCAFI